MTQPSLLGSAFGSGSGAGWGWGAGTGSGAGSGSGSGTGWGWGWGAGTGSGTGAGGRLGSRSAKVSKTADCADSAGFGAEDDGVVAARVLAGATVGFGAPSFGVVISARSKVASRCGLGVTALLVVGGAATGRAEIDRAHPPRKPLTTNSAIATRFDISNLAMKRP